MDIPKIFESEYRFCLILWENEPIRSTELVKLCTEKLGWKPTTTYTVIKRLRERGVLESRDGLIASLVSKDDAQQAEIDELVQTRFGGSMPSFIAAFTRKRRMSEGEIDSIQRMIDRAREGEGQ